MSSRHLLLQLVSSRLSWRVCVEIANNGHQHVAEAGLQPFEAQFLYAFERLGACTLDDLGVLTESVWQHMRRSTAPSKGNCHDHVHTGSCGRGHPCGAAAPAAACAELSEGAVHQHPRRRDLLSAIAKADQQSRRLQRCRTGPQCTDPAAQPPHGASPRPSRKQMTSSEAWTTVCHCSHVVIYIHAIQHWRSCMRLRVGRRAGQELCGSNRAGACS